MLCTRLCANTLPAFHFTIVAFFVGGLVLIWPRNDETGAP
jgi:hypothetical protein